ncbi:hypothetical protein [Hymenobacter negativus]|uniref:DUF4833 domain-containing protein n=1 Tax=Hymenobacter negativus TaxID=2795026 RepID=A0ABS3QA65_9BACT|nr:hypothetical protein [Hymenobacter negativus]MBO2008001.1 hypothetical protein [Hymenobacter negativus]
MKAFLPLVSAALLACHKLFPELGPQPIPAPILSASISFDRLLWLREQSFSVVDHYLRNRGWKFISKRKDANAQNSEYAYTACKWAYPNPLSPQAGDTLFLSTSKYPLEMGMVCYYSPTPEEYMRIRAVVKARHFPYSGHSGPENSDFMIFEGPHQSVSLSVRAEEPGQKYQVGIEYRNPKMVEFLPPPLPPKQGR